MKELLEKILGQIKKTPSGVRAYEDLYHICLETQKTDIPLSVEYLKKLSDIIENRIPQSETDKELRSLFMLHKKHRFSTLTCRAIKLTFEIENISSSDRLVSASDFKCYADDTAMSDYYSFSFNDYLSTTTISAGRKATGNVYFEVPQNANSIDVEYETNYWSGNKAIFVVK